MALLDTGTVASSVPVSAARLSTTAVLVTLALLGLLLHCGSDDEGSTFPSPCDTVYKGKCGQPCTDDNACPTGLHCTPDQKCTAQCTPSGRECDGAPCSARGRCGGDDGGLFGDGGSEGSCPDTAVTLSKVTPTVLLLVDQSSSMQDNEFPPGSGETRWDVLRSALLDVDGGVVKTLENEVSFGLSLYTWTAGDLACPRLTNVGWAIGNYDEINAVYGPAVAVDNTPTAESIMGVVGFDDAGTPVGDGFAQAATPGPKIVLLATDGDPDTCECPDCNGEQGPRDFTVWAAERAHAAGVETYVISIGDELNETHQQQVANVGLGYDPNAGAVAPLYRPNDRAQLVGALRKIILGVRDCKFSLSGSVVAGTEDQGIVTLDGAPLPFNDPNGWRLSSPSEIEVLGDACTTLSTSPTAEVTARFPCGAIVPK